MKKTLESGAVLDMTMAPFVEGHRLFKAVAKELKAVHIQANGQAEGALNAIKDIVASLVSSDEVESALWACMGRAAWNGRKAEPGLFEDEKAREDFLIIQKEVLLFNLGPFQKSLKSMFSDVSSLLMLNIQK